MTKPTVRAAFPTWGEANRRLVARVANLTEEQLALQPTPDRWPLWASIGHLACQRVFGLCDFGGEPGAAESPFPNAGFNCPGDDDLEHVWSSEQLVDALERTFAIIDRVLDTYTLESLEEVISHPEWGPDWVRTRGENLQRTFAHDLWHLAELNEALTRAGLAPLDIWEPLVTEFDGRGVLERSQLGDPTVNAATTRRLGDQMAALHGPALWTLAGFVIYVLGAFGGLFLIVVIEAPLLAMFGLRAEAGTLGLSVQNGLHAITWGLLTAAVAWPLGRRLVPGSRFGVLGWAMLLVGLVIAAFAMTLGNEFVRARYGWYDAEYQGLSLFAGPAIVAIALATWAALAVPRSGVLVPGAAMLTAAAGLVLSLVPSIPGASDGVDAASIPLVAAFLVGVGYAALAAILVLLRLWRPTG